MSPDELLAALHKAMEETERLARRASADRTTGESWRFHRLPLRPGFAHVYGDIGTHVLFDVLETIAEHAAHHDPASVLRRLAADRYIVALYEDTSRVLRSRTDDDTATLATLVSAYEVVVRALAAGYGIETEVSGG